MRNLFQDRFLKQKALILLLYFLFAALLSSYHRYFIHLADTFEYLRIAEDYARGDFSEAVNSFWSPMFSWLLALLLKIGVEPFFAIQLLQIIIGSLALSGLLVLIPFKEQSMILYLLFFFSFLILILSFALLVASPDLLLLTISIWYLILVFKYNFYITNKYSFLLFGLVGAVLYFAKGAGFVFFLFSFSLINLVYYLKNDFNKKIIITKYISTVIVFLILASFWIIPISLKENKVLFSSAPEYNFKLIGPASNPNILGELHHPYEWMGLISPPQKNSINAWEEPQKLKIDNWSPLDNGKNLFHYIKIVFKNLWSIQAYYFGLDAGTILFLGLLLLFIYKKSEAVFVLKENIIPIIISVSCTLPYIFVLITDRYIWINNVVIGIVAFSIFSYLSVVNKKISIAFSLAFSFLIAYKPARELLETHNDYSDIFAERDSLSKHILGNTASVLTKNEIGGENYTKSTIVNYLSQGKYFGMICVPKEVSTMNDDLKRHKIKYLFSWNNSFSMPDSLYFDAVEFPKIGAKVYKLK